MSEPVDTSATSPVDTSHVETSATSVDTPVTSPVDTSAMQPVDTSVMQQPVSEKEIDVNSSVASKNSLTTRLSRSWATEIPPLVVERIYLFLNRRDQSRMSMVCKNWAEEYKCPSIWRNFEFVIPSENYSSEVCPEVRRAQIFGDMFHDVKIICKNHSYNLKKVISDQFLEFLEALTSRSQLLSFHIQITFLQLNLDQEVYEKLIRSIVSFIQSQNKLKVVRFINTFLDKPEFIQILEELIIKKPITLKRLYLIGINENPGDRTQDFFQNARGFYDMLLNVNHLFIDYSLIFERIIHCLKDTIKNDNLSLRLEPMRFHLFANGSVEDFYQGIEARSWEILSKHWPTLNVGLYYIVFATEMTFSFEKLIVRNMPLTFFECNLRQLDMPLVNNIFRHLILTEVCNCLVVIKIASTETTNYVNDLIALLLHCPNLQEFTIDVKQCATDVDLLFDFISENGMRNLNSFCLKLPDLLPEDLPLYNGVITKYSIIMREMDVKLRSSTAIANSALKMDIICSKVYGINAGCMRTVTSRHSPNK